MQKSFVRTAVKFSRRIQISACIAESVSDNYIMKSSENPRFKLKSCVWEITLACCFSCRYCGSRAGKARDNELTTAECLNIAEQLAQLGCKRVSLIGGEVFMRPDWFETVKALTDRGVKVSIITNGYLSSDKLIDKLKKGRVESVAVSLDGPQEIHDMYRQPGSFERAINAISVLSKNDIPISVITTLHGKNAPLLNEMYEILKDTNIFAWQLQACSPMGNAEKFGISSDFDFNTVIDFVSSHIDKAKFSIGIADNIGYYTPQEPKLRGSVIQPVSFTGCRAGLTTIGIDSVGNVRGCESMYDERFIEGNLREMSLSEIWNSPNAFAYNRQFKKVHISGDCQYCEHFKYCAGGCRSYNYFVHQNMYDSPSCALKINKKYEPASPHFNGSN